MARLPATLLLFLLTSLAVLAQSDGVSYHYHASSDDEGRGWWNVMTVSAMGRPGFYFGMGPTGERRLGFLQGDTNCGRTILDSTIAPIDLSSDGSYSITAARDVAISIIDTASAKSPVRQSLPAGNRLTIETAQYPPGLYIIVVEHAGLVVNFARFIRSDAAADPRLPPARSR